MDPADPWLARRLCEIGTHRGPTVLIGGAEWGAPYLISRFAESGRTLIWVELDARDANDSVSQGNKLSDAVRRALGSPLFGYGAPYGYGVGILRLHVELLGPLTFALSGAEYGEQMAHEILQLHRNGIHVVLAFTALPRDFRVPSSARRLDRSRLRVTKQEAEGLVRARLKKEEIHKLWKAANAQYETFIVTLHARLSLPTPLRPSPEGPRLPPGHEVTASPKALVDVLVRRSRWSEALELSVSYLPDRASAILAKAGHAFHERGLHRHLWDLLTKLPSKIQHDDVVLFWRLSSAARLGRAEGERPEVEAYLAQHEAPDLRALYAGTLAPVESALAQAERAYHASQTPLTCYQLGYHMILRDRSQAIELLRLSVTLAEQQGHPYEVARNAWALAVALNGAGHYREGASWAAWALEQFDRAGLEDRQRRLTILNDLAFARILVGRTVGLDSTLKEGEALLPEAFPALARLFQGTLGDFLLSAGRPEEALGYYRVKWRQTTRSTLAGDARDMVRALLELGRVAEALEIGEQAYHLCRGEFSVHRRTSELAYGMALAFSDPKAAETVLGAAYEAYRQPLLAYRLVQTALHLAKARLELGDSGGAHAVIAGARQGLLGLAESGLRLLAGPWDAFNDVRSMLDGKVSPLEFRFLGGREVRFSDRRLVLPQRWCDILTVLALQPHGVAGERLLLEVYGDSGNPTNLKAAVSKLRRIIPIASRPYRISVPYRADFLEMEALLRDGRVRDALHLCRGPLLAQSEAEGVVSARQVLDASLRQAVLKSGDTEFLLDLARRLGDDLEVWEAGLRALRPGDARYSVVQARVDQVRRSWS